MSDLQECIARRKIENPDFAEGYDEGYRHFRIGVTLKQARQNAGMMQDELAEKLQTHKSVISRIENHAEDIRLSTLSHYGGRLR
ncbi:MAG: helix-turn-helix transcriptional regulator [Chlorobium sp.]